jgi:hypothetical protein
MHPILLRSFLLPSAALLFAATVIVGLGTARAAMGEPWSEVTGQRAAKSVLNRAGTTIKAVDGRPLLQGLARVTPGPHAVTVHWLPKKGLSTSDRVLRLDMKPCRRYFVHAQFASPGSTLWQPVVDKVEAIPGCEVPGAAALPPPESPR